MNTAEALEYLLGTTCGGCGGTLPGPGEPCAGYGRIPDVTGPELADELDGPLALAAVEAAKLRAEAWAAHDAAVAKMAQADRLVFTARLQVRQDEAQRALDEHARRHKSLYGPRSAARKAEEKAAAELTEATRSTGAGQCAVPECRRPWKSRNSGLCAAHDRQRIKTSGRSLEEFICHPDVRPLPGFGPCAVHACYRDALGLGYCDPHRHLLRTACRDPGFDLARWEQTAPAPAECLVVSLRALPDLVVAQLLYGMQQKKAQGEPVRDHTLRVLADRLRLAQGSCSTRSAPAAADHEESRREEP